MRPADKSVPAISIVEQMPRAIIILIDDCERISSKTSNCKKRGSITAMTIIITRSAKTSAYLRKKSFAF